MLRIFFFSVSLKCGLCVCWLFFCFALHPFIKIYRIHWFLCHYHTHTQAYKKKKLRAQIFSLCTTYCVPYLNFICIFRRKRKKFYVMLIILFHSIQSFSFYVYSFLRQMIIEKMIFEIIYPNKVLPFISLISPLNHVNVMNELTTGNSFPKHFQNYLFCF